MQDCFLFLQEFLLSVWQTLSLYILYSILLIREFYKFPLFLLFLYMSKNTIPMIDKLEKSFGYFFHVYIFIWATKCTQVEFLLLIRESCMVQSWISIGERLLTASTVIILVNSFVWWIIRVDCHLFVSIEIILDAVMAQYFQK